MIPVALGLVVLIFYQLFVWPRRRRAARREAEWFHEIQTVQAMTEELKAEYWARKHAEAKAHRLSMSNGRIAIRVLVSFIGIFALCVAGSIFFGK
jgi:hypothetical protein